MEKQGIKLTGKDYARLIENLVQIVGFTDEDLQINPSATILELLECLKSEYAGKKIIIWLGENREGSYLE